MNTQHFNVIGISISDESIPLATLKSKSIANEIIIALEDIELSYQTTYPYVFRLYTNTKNYLSIIPRLYKVDGSEQYILSTYTSLAANNKEDFNGKSFSYTYNPGNQHLNIIDFFGSDADEQITVPKMKTTLKNNTLTWIYNSPGWIMDYNSIDNQTLCPISCFLIHGYSGYHLGCKCIIPSAYLFRRRNRSLASIHRSKFSEISELNY